LPGGADTNGLMGSFSRGNRRDDIAECRIVPPNRERLVVELSRNCRTKIASSAGNGKGAALAGPPAALINFVEIKPAIAMSGTK